MAVKLNLRERLMPILVEAVQVAGVELSEHLIVDLDHECPAFHHKKGAYAGGATGHSMPGAIPFKETGKGQDSVGVENTDIGCRVGVTSIADDEGEVAPNHLLWHDPEFGGGERPWLSNWAQSYEGMFKSAVIDRLKDSLPAAKVTAL